MALQPVKATGCCQKLLFLVVMKRQHYLASSDGKDDDELCDKDTHEHR